MRRILQITFLIVLIVGIALGQQSAEPIIKEGLLGALRIKALSAKELVDEIKRNGVSFKLTATEEQEIRRVGKYLGRKGLDDLIAAILANYRKGQPPAESRKPLLERGSDGEPLSFFREIEIKDGLDTPHLDKLMKAVGYRGPTTVMSVLIVKNNDSSKYYVMIGTISKATQKNSITLQPGDQFKFPVGENAANIWLFSLGEAKIDVAYRPTPIKLLSIGDWIESDEGQQLATQIVNDVEKLADEARLMDATDYEAAIKTFKAWVEKVSVAMGSVDIEMRRFNRRTDFKFQWDKENYDVANFLSVDEKKRFLKLEIHRAINRLDVYKVEIRSNTRHDVER